MDENFKVIVDPETNKSVPIESAVGQQVIKNYIECIRNGPESKNITSTKMFYKPRKKTTTQNAGSKKARGSIRGVCGTCKKNVLSTQERIKNTGKYYHEACFNK